MIVVMVVFVLLVGDSTTFLVVVVVCVFLSFSPLLLDSVVKRVGLCVDLADEGSSSVSLELFVIFEAESLCKLFLSLVRIALRGISLT